MKKVKPSGSIKSRSESKAEPFLNMTVAKVEQPVKEGFLHKNGEKRWFALKDSRLYYFKNKDAKTPLQGTIELDASTVIDKTADAKKHGFDITVHEGRVFHLRAHDEEEKTAWIEAIEKEAAKVPAPAKPADNGEKAAADAAGKHEKGTQISAPEDQRL